MNAQGVLEVSTHGVNAPDVALWRYEPGLALAYTSVRQRANQWQTLGLQVGRSTAAARRAASFRNKLGEAADLHRNHIGFVERGERAPSIEISRQIGVALGLSLSALIAEAERKLDRSRPK